MSLALRVLASPTAPPLDPGANDARNQLVRELSKAEYQSAKPSLFDIISKALTDWLNSLFGTRIGVPGALGPIVIVVIVVVALGIAFLVFGLPRLNRRGAVAGTLFGEDDARSAQELRRAAERAAAAADYAAAIADGFRAIARGLSERTVVLTFPGTTAHGFAEQAAASFPASAAALRSAADSFDGVRYLGTPGTETEWLAVSALDAELRAARPVLEDVRG
jgi:hypothetical protein